MEAAGEQRRGRSERPLHWLTAERPRQDGGQCTGSGQACAQLACGRNVMKTSVPSSEQRWLQEVQRSGVRGERKHDSVGHSEPQRCALGVSISCGWTGR